MKYIFKSSGYDSDLLINQLSSVLENRMESYSRSKMPLSWKVIDQFEGAAKVSDEVLKKRRKRYKIYGVLYLAVGTFLTIPGLVEPKKLKVVLITGLLLIALGIIHIKPRKDNKKKFNEEALKILNNYKRKEEIIIDKILYFDDNGFFEDNNEKIYSYNDVDSIYISKDAYFFIYADNILVIQKKDNQNNSNVEFSKFLHSKFGEKAKNID